MKKFFVISLTILFASTTQAQNMDSVNLNSPEGRQFIEMACHATPEIVFQNMKYETVKKYKSKNLYMYGNNMSVSAPVMGERMLSYNGKYFYSLSKQMFVVQVPRAQKTQKTPEEVAQRQQAMGTVINLGRNILARKGIFVPGL